MVEISENMNEYKQSISGDCIEVYIGDMHNTRSIYFEVKNNFVDTDIVFNASAEYVSIDGSQERIAASATMTVIDDIQKLHESEKNEDILNSIVSMIKNKAIRDASSYVENNDNEKMHDVIRQSSATLDNLSMSFCASTKPALEELKELSVEYSVKNVSKEVLKRNYAYSNRSMRESN